MKRKVLIMLFLLSSVSSYWVQAQSDSVKVESPFDFRYRAGVRMGLNLADMYFSHNPVDRYSHQMQGRLIAGLFYGERLGESNFSLWSDVSYVGRGVRLRWLDVDYRMRVDYIDLRVPVVYSFNLPSTPLVPYVMVSPVFGLACGGEIEYTSYDYPGGVNCEVTNADMQGVDFGLMAGVGVEYLTHVRDIPLIFGIEAGYNMGLVNTFARREHLESAGYTSEGPSVIANPFFGAELWQGGRYSRGVELALRVSMPFGRKVVEPEPEPEPEPLMEMIREVVAPETVFVTLPPQIDTVLKREYVWKDCYTIPEMFSFLTTGIDISDKRICLFNINFDFDSYVLRPESKRPLNELYMLMSAFPEVNIEVYGHTDSIGTDEYNQTLSENRAQAVVDYLVSYGVEPHRIKAKGFGERYPIETNETEEGRFHNRRVEFDIQLPKQTIIRKVDEGTEEE